MQSKEQQLTPSFSIDKEIERAKWFKEDLDKGGWSQRYKVPGEFDSWSKTIPDEEVCIKVLNMFENLPMSAEKFAQVMDPSNIEIRGKWDEAFKDLEVLEVLPDGGCVIFAPIKLSFPLADRSFVLHVSPTMKDVDWYGKKAFAIFMKDARHPSKPLGEDGLVRATNGGNFYIAFPDDNQPETTCHVFGLTNNNYNGAIPKTKIEWLVGRLAPKTFYKVRGNLIEGYKKYFDKDH